MERIVSFLGLFILMGIAWLLGSHRRKVSLRIVVGGVILQFLLAFLVLRTGAGRWIIDGAGHLFRVLIGYADAGSTFVFGENFPESHFAFRVLPIIIFFAALASILYHLGILQLVVKAAAFIMQKTLKTSGAETLCTAANIFVGMTEAPLVVRPYLSALTRSELMAVMVGGMATIAGSVLAAYISMGIDAGHLLTASVISAPAALLIAKILEPEVERPKTLGHVTIDVEKETVNLLHAVTTGATAGVKLAINVAAMLIAFLALIALANGLLAWTGGQFGQDWSLEAFFGYLFAPLAWIMGVEGTDCLKVGELLGMKIVANEFIAYDRLGSWLEEGSEVQLSARSVIISTYALCGFANLGSIGVQLGGLGPLIPSRQGELARLALRAMVGGALAGFMTACVAGVIL